MPIAYAATITVTNLNDSGVGSLRHAITDAMASGATDTINFSVSGTITLLTSLPNITSAGGTLTIDGSGRSVTISGNNTVRVFYVNSGGTLNLTNLTVANGNASGGGGGSLFNNQGIVTITNATFSGNSDVDYGGAIFNSQGAVTITNSTFSGNSTSGNGGGIFNNGGTVNITHGAFSGNSAGGSGSGINNGSGSVTLRNTIVANSPLGGNCAATIANSGYNIDSGTTCGWGSASGSMSITNPLLGALANNGGPTQTMALQAGSPALDRIPNAGGCGAGVTTDQSGTARPQPTGGLCDIGAYELVQQPQPTPTPAEVPEADTLFLLGGGIGGLATWLRFQWARRRK